MKIVLYIPCFNSAQTIQACLEAALQQERPADQILVVDDGSTDATTAIAKKYPVKIVRHSENRGLAAARNTGIKNTDAEFIASLDSDCKPNKDWLGCLIKNIHPPDTAGAGGRVEEGNISSLFDAWRSIHMQQHWGADKKTNPPFLFGSNTLFRREALIKAGLYNESYRNNFEDVDISTRLRKIGYNLVYEPQAAAVHLKKDDLFSLLNNFWRWNLVFYIKKGFYRKPDKFILKVKDNIGLANRFLEEDLKGKREKLVYLDFLIALHHSLRDFDYFNFYGKQGQFNADPYSKEPFWLSLLDLTFFYHLDHSKKSLDSFVSQENNFKQNFLALNLLLSGFIQTKFGNSWFKKTLYRHLFLSLYRAYDDQLLGRLLTLSESHEDWDGLVKKMQVSLNSEFLEALSSHFREWVENLTCSFPDIIKVIEKSAQQTEEATAAAS